MLQDLGLWICRVFGLKVITRSQMDDLLFEGYRIDTATLLKNIAKNRVKLGKTAFNLRRKADQMRAQATQNDVEALEADTHAARLAEVEKQLQ